jgi:hypothetical protein
MAWIWLRHLPYRSHIQAICHIGEISEYNFMVTHGPCYQQTLKELQALNNNDVNNTTQDDLQLEIP